MSATTRGLRYPPLTGVTPDVPRDVGNLAADIDGMFISGLFADRPAAAKIGRHYWATDTGVEYVDLGSSWVTPHAAPVGAAGGVLGGSYPNPTFSADMATQSELNALTVLENKHLVGSGGGEPAFQNGWDNFGAGFYLSYYKQLGFGHIDGWVYRSAGAWGVTIFTLPTAYLPDLPSPGSYNLEDLAVNFQDNVPVIVCIENSGEVHTKLSTADRVRFNLHYRLKTP